MTDNTRITTLRRLVIRVSRQSLSFSTTDGNDVVYESYPLNSSISIAANMREALRNVSLLSLSFGQVVMMVDTPVLMVPSDLFEESAMEESYYHAFTPEGQQVVTHTVLPDLNSVAVFAYPKDLRTVVTDTFSNVHVIAALSPLWRHLNQRSYTGPHRKMYAYFHEKRVDVFSFAQNRFKFCNSFAVTNAADALYYILSVWKQLGLSPEHEEMYLSGSFSEMDILKNQLETFIKRVFFINPQGEFNRAHVTQIEGIPYDLVVLYVKGL